ncbi:MAG TPA: CsgG/HfaB family protein [Polyangia bacterium]
MLVCLGGVAHAANDKAPLRVAVMDFTPASTAAEFEPLGAGLQSMITTDLGEVPAIVLVERARLKDIQAELHLSQSGAVDKATAAKIGSLAGASHLLVGSFTVVGGKMRLDARLFAVATGEVALAEKMEGAQTSFFELEQKLVRKIIDSVGVKLGKKEKADLSKPQTTDFEAFEKYSQGLAFADEKKTAEAVAAMRAAVQKDPNFALAAKKLADLQALLASLPPPPKPPEAASCKPNPLLSQPCNSPGQPPTAQPTIFTGGDDRSFGVVVRTQGEEARCLTPCQLYLPPGQAQVEVLTPVHYTTTVQVPNAPTHLTVSGLNKTNIIIGAVLAGIALGATGATIGLHENTGSATASTSEEFWPLTFAIATSAFFPAVYYLMKMGSNSAKVKALP